MTINQLTLKVTTPENVEDHEAEQMRHLFADAHRHAARNLQGDRRLALERAINNEMRKGLQDPQKRLASSPNCLLVIRQNEEIVAYCSLQHRDQQTAELKNVICSPQHHGYGLGRQLMQAVEQKAAELGYQRMFLWTYGHLEPAIHMYLGRGYRYTGKEPPTAEPAILEPLHMELILPNGSEEQDGERPCFD